VKLYWSDAFSPTLPCRLYDKKSKMILKMNGRTFITSVMTLMLLFFPMAATSTVKTAVSADILSLIRSESFSGLYPRSSAIILLNQKTVTWKRGGSTQTDIHLLIRIQDEAGIRKFGDFRFNYLEGRETVSVLLARTINRAFRFIPVEEKAINRLTHQSVASTPDYWGHKQLIISFPALEVGVVIELKLRKEDQAIPGEENPFFWGSEVFQSTDPIREKIFELRIPQSRRITIQSLNGLQDPTIKSSKGDFSYTWKEDRIAPLKLEPHMPSRAGIVPIANYTSAVSWEEIGHWFEGRFNRDLQNNASIKRIVQELIGGTGSVEEKIRTLYFDISGHIRNVALPLNIHEFSSQSPSRIYQNGYGGPMDKAILLALMLKVAGIDAFPAFASSRGNAMANQFPSLNQFEKLFLMIPVHDSDPVILDPSSQFCRYSRTPGTRNNSIFVIRQGRITFQQLDRHSDSSSRVSVNLDLKLDTNGNAIGKLRVSYGGYFDCMIRRLRGKSARELKPFFSNMAALIGEGTSLSSFSVSDLTDRVQTAEVDMNFESTELGLVQGDLMILHLPPLLNPFIPLTAVSESRHFDYQPGFPFSNEFTGKINIPPDYRIFRLPKKIDIQGEFGFFKIDFRLDKKTSDINFTYKISVKSGIIPQPQYLEFKRAFDLFKSRKTRLILLRKKSTRTSTN